MSKLKAPFPYFGGKSKVANMIWRYLGDPDNYVEPFAGSAAVLWARPHPPRIETINDADCMVANFWRATRQAPEAVAFHADWPVNEADLHARHRWLVLSDEARAFREKMRTDPDYFDAKIAGWWVWGLCCWIGGGWCSAPSEVERNAGATPALAGSDGKGQGVTRNLDGRKPRIDGGNGQHGHGVHGKSKVRIDGDNPGSHGKGVHAKGAMPNLSGDIGAAGRGVHASGGPAKGRRAFHEVEQTPKDASGLGGVHAKMPNCDRRGDAAAVGNRPQLADAYARGRGVHGNDDAGTCAQRLAWLTGWLCRLRDRLRTVRVCCGDWLRVCDSDSVTVRLGTTGIFFDPPYGAAAGRDPNLYAVDCLKVADDVRRYCLERGDDPRMRIVLAGYAGEGHEELERHGWEAIAWRASGGYGNRSEKGKGNATKERLWVSPHCCKELTLFE